MSKYDKDLRVAKWNRGYAVTTEVGEYLVLLTDLLGWSIFAVGTTPSFDQGGGGALGYGYSHADAAINALIGQPR